MPLINFRTNLTTLRYGLDRPGGGDSGQPYIQFPIENASTPVAIRDYYEANRTGLDFPVRGGKISQLVAGEFGIISSTVDRERIEKFFNDSPRGTAFIQKQVGLQLTNPKLQVPNSIAFAGPALDNAVLPVTNVYNPANTLAQVQAMGTGAFFNRHGVAPTIYEAPQQTYQYIVGNRENNTEVTNRLVILKALKLIGDTNFLLNSSNLQGLSIDPLLVDRLGISTIQNQLFNYSGGPGSAYGIGFTRIFRYTDTNTTELLSNSTQGFTIGGDATPDGVSKPYSAIALTYAQLATQGTRTTNPTSPVQAAIQDFRGETNDGTPIIPHSNYGVYNIASYTKGGIGIGNPGAPSKNVDYRVSKPTGIDRVNAKNLFYFNPNASDPWRAGGKQETKDIIKFAFECISNNDSDQAIAIVMRAFLEGQISDSNTADYNSFRYLGRGETFRVYQGFNRTISFTFKVFAQSRAEMKPLYRKLNNLISQVYPDYSPTSNLMRGNVVKLTIGDYIYRMPGFLQNVNITIDNSNTPWEIVLNSEDFPEDDVAQLPHMVTVACTFLPIMDILPRKESIESPYVPLIANNGYLSGSVIDDPLVRTISRADTLSADPILLQRPPLQRPATINRTLTNNPVIF